MFRFCFSTSNRVQSSRPASAAMSIPPNLVLTRTCLIPINVLSVTVSKRRVEFCSSGIQVASWSRVEFRRYRSQPERLHCLHDPQPTLCVVPLLARNTCTAVDQATLPYFLVVLSMGLAYPDTTNPSCLLYTSPSPRDLSTSRMPSSA